MSNRRADYNFWQNLAKTNRLFTPAFDTLPPGVCPLGFPIKVKNRDWLKARLQQEGVHLKIYWHLPAAVGKEFGNSHELSRQMATLPIYPELGRKRTRNNLAGLVIMIQCVFTVDYEIYGNGTGSLRELVYEPAERLREIFRKRNARFVVFVETAELEMIETTGTDSDIDLVKNQIRQLYVEGFELGLHIHPWWYNARYKNGKWLLDQAEYDFCSLPPERIAEMIDRSTSYFRRILAIRDFVPFSHRAGHLLFQDTRIAAKILAERGTKVDSSVYKGGVWYQYNLNYRPALKNGYYWRFSDSANIPDARGVMLELPIYTKMAPVWKMFTAKKASLQRKASLAARIDGKTSVHERVSFVARTGRKMLRCFVDYLHLRYPLKLDFCAMTAKEMKDVVDRVIKEEQKDPKSLKPLVSIGHTKDLVDFEAVEALLSHLEQNGITISTFEDVYRRCESSIV